MKMLRIVKCNLIKYLLLIVVVSLIIGCGEEYKETEYEDKVIQFTDQNLETVIREALNKTEGNLTAKDVEGLTKLDAADKDISNLSGIEFCTNLQDLNLEANKIKDLSPLGSLANLRKLDLEINVDISDITPLGSLTKLEVLDLSYLEFQTIDVDTLNKLTSLRELDLGGLWMDMSPLSKLTINLQILLLYNNGITNIDFLSNLTSLEVLSLSFENQIKNISPLSNLTNLRVLYLDGNEITDISPLERLTKIGDWQGDYEVREIDGIKIHLGLAGNVISDIAPLVNNVGIGKGDGVNLQSNPLDDVAQGIYIPALQERGVEVLFDQ